MMSGLSRQAMVDVVERYYEGCNEASEAKIRSALTEAAVHYFPAGAAQGTFFGADAIARGWIAAVSRLDSRWTIDHLLVDEASSEAAIEWTHWKPNQGIYLRGTELCRFDSFGLIDEIRAYYAVPTETHPRIYELGSFDYKARDYPTEPPRVNRVPARKS